MKNEDNIFKLLEKSNNDILKWFAIASTTILAKRIDEAAKQNDTDTDIDIEAIKIEAYNTGYEKALHDVKAEMKRTSKTLSKLIGDDDEDEEES